MELIDAPLSDLSRLSLVQTIGQLIAIPARRMQLATQARCIVDGYGGARVAAVLVLSLNADFWLRLASVDDEQLLLDWANDPDVRAQAFSSDLISKSTHAVWFQNKIADVENCYLFIAVAPNGTPMGQVRFDRVVPIMEKWNIDYSLGHAFRGNRLARTFLAKAFNEVTIRCGSSTTFVAQVKSGNEASVKTFQTLGFTESKADLTVSNSREFQLKIEAEKL